MRLLLDESVPRRVRQYLPGHTVRTVVAMGWGGIRNGDVLSLAASEFDAFITVDKNLRYQQNLFVLPIAVVILRAHSNELHALMPLLPKLEEALASLKPRSFVQVGP